MPIQSGSERGISFPSSPTEASPVPTRLGLARPLPSVPASRLLLLAVAQRGAGWLLLLHTPTRD